MVVQCRVSSLETIHIQMVNGLRFIVFDSQFEDASLITGKPWQSVLEGVYHTVFSVRKQTAVTAGARLILFVLFSPGPLLWNSVVHNKMGLPSSVI